MLGIPSSGIHSNGFSLVRKLIKDNGLPLTKNLLEPTRIYVNECLDTKYNVKAFVHITGGGLIENIPRVLPDKLAPIFFDWKLPQVFQDIKDCGDLTHDEMMRTFNCGYGMVAILAPDNINKFVVDVPSAIIIGEIREKE